MDRAPAKVWWTAAAFTLGYWLAVSWWSSSSGHWRVVSVGWALAVTVWGAGHLVARRGVHRHTQRATVVIGVVIVAQGILSLTTSRAPLEDLLLGLVAFCVFDALGEVLFWRYAMSGVAKSILNARRLARPTASGGPPEHP